MKTIIIIKKKIGKIWILCSSEAYRKMNANLTQLPTIHSIYIYYMYICISIRFADVYTVLLWTIMQWRLEIFFYISNYNHKLNIKYYELKKKQIVLFVHLVIINPSELFLFTIDNKPIYGQWPVNYTLSNTNVTTKHPIRL